MFMTMIDGALAVSVKQFRYKKEQLKMHITSSKKKLRNHTAHTHGCHCT
jgi:hypothetical protein